MADQVPGGEAFESGEAGADLALKLGGGVEAEVADEAADVGPGLLLDLGTSFLSSGRDRVTVTVQVKQEP